MRSMVTGDHDISPTEDIWSERQRYAHAREWSDDWQYGVLWRFVPRPDDGTGPTFEPFGPDDLPGGGWELNIDRGEDGTETRSPAQPDVLMQLTYWRRRSPGMKPWAPAHKVSRQYPA